MRQIKPRIGSSQSGGKTQRGGSGEARVPGVEEKLREVEVEKQQYPVWWKDFG